MRKAGLDIGSRTIKVAVIENGRLIHSHKKISSHDPISLCKDMLKDVTFDSLVATGYGRHLAKEYLECPVISEIKAFAQGARFFSPTCRTVLDIGGQDTKAVLLSENGKLDRFEMNDKCAAGTGRFLEIMASALGFTIEDFISSASGAEEEQQINTTCTVFAESEVVSLVNKGISRNEIARGIHRSVVQRSLSLLKRVSAEGELLFAGGVAYNSCICSMIEETLGAKIFVPEDPQIVGAVGAALTA